MKSPLWLPTEKYGSHFTVTSWVRVCVCVCACMSVCEGIGSFSLTHVALDRKAHTSSIALVSKNYFNSPRNIF